jgi:hypothetical protein
MAQAITSNQNESINPIAMLFSNYDLDQINEAFLKLCSNRKAYDKHALSYFLNMSDSRGMHLILCDIRKRDEIFSMLESRIKSNPTMIFKLVKSDYTANKLIEILQKEVKAPKQQEIKAQEISDDLFIEGYLQLKEHLAEGIGYICEDILPDAWNYFSELPYEQIREKLIDALMLDQMFKSEEEGGASC